MAKIQLENGHTWERLPEARVRRVLALEIVTERLALMCSEWQDIADSEGKALWEMQASVGLLLSDVFDLLDHNPTERAKVFGPELVEVLA